MTEHGDPQASDRTSTPPQPGRSRSWWPVIAPALALLVGLVLGGVLVGVVVGDDEAPSADPQPSASPSAGDASVSPSAGATVIVIPDECLDAVDTVEQAADLARRSAGAIRDFRTEELRSLLRELESLDQQARAQAEACKAVEAQSQAQ